MTQTGYCPTVRAVYEIQWACDVKPDLYSLNQGQNKRSVMASGYKHRVVASYAAVWRSSVFTSALGLDKIDCNVLIAYRHSL